ncbi:Alpha-fetoprotein [Trichinella spiralis]|uniref:Alpha-fetoprotein n=1 Tax=Trichinella spiralis TaxID=6334 RepID=A0ABR3KEL4_TRISP
MTSPFIYYNDVPDAEVNTRPSLKKVLSGETALKPPFSQNRTLRHKQIPRFPFKYSANLNDQNMKYTIK